MADPFRIEGPATISFSGGRTSAYMLWRILEAHGGVLPSGVVVVFANTGKEREETLRFVHECSVRWSVPIHWVEWQREAPGFSEVGYNSASREGEPFDALIEWKRGLPNWQARWCTGYLKVGAMTAFLTSIGWQPGSYAEVIGLRDDEGMRVMKMYERNDRDGRRCVAPLSKAKITRLDVMAFWSAQPFDLDLRPGEGNCDLCFLKGRGLRKALIRERPGSDAWWRKHEVNGRFFDRRDTYAELAAEVDESPDLFDAEHDAECGLLCAVLEPSP